ncbi:MAG: hypothetical protein MUF77_03090 [Leptospira sp.]|nr:hypothetical protein [Leptospira sp.]
MAEKKKSVVEDILKREKLTKDFEKEKIVSEKKSIENAVESISKATESNQESAKSSKFIKSIDIAFSQAKADLRYYFLNDGSFGDEFKRLFNENEDLFKRYGITSQKYLDYIRESFDRYKKIHNMMPLEPMKLKQFKYVEESITELVRMFNQRFGK